MSEDEFILRDKDGNPLRINMEDDWKKVYRKDFNGTYYYWSTTNDSISSDKIYIKEDEEP